MKDSQWLFAALLLAALVFIAVFATQYIGTNTPMPGGTVAPQVTFRTLKHLGDPYDDKYPPLEVEEGTKGWQDFFLLNTNEVSVKVGLNRTSCRCSAVELFVVPGDGEMWVTKLATSLFSAGQTGHLHFLNAHQGIVRLLETKAEKHELLAGTETAPVPAGGLAWARLRFHAEKPSTVTTLTAHLWFDDPGGATLTLGTQMMAHEAYKLRPLLNVGVLKEEELKKGVTRYIEVWSSTRPSFKVTAQPLTARPVGPSDTFLVGAPIPMTRAQLAEVSRGVVSDPELPLNLKGPALGGYRIPVTFLGTSADGKVPLEVGPFHRRVLIDCPNLPGGEDGKGVLIVGRAEGLIEIGSDPMTGSEVRFGPFRRDRGASSHVMLSTSTPNVTLTVNREKTPSYLKATLPAKPTVAEKNGVPYRWFWRVKVEALPKTVLGQFPRRDDPAYEDAAFYFNAEQGGRVVPVRVATSGTASE